MAIDVYANGNGKQVVEQDLVIGTHDGNCPARVFVPAGAGQWPAVIFFMDGYGMRPTVLDMARRLAGYGFVVLAPDMYYRNGPYPPTTAAEIREPERLYGKLVPWISSTDNLKAASDAGAFLDYLDTRSDVLGSKVGVVGYCLSGAMALAVAGTYPERIGAAASFHGGGLATDAPTSPHLFASRIKARVLVAAADNDPYFPPEMSARLAASLSEAGVDHVIDVYAGAHHGWTMQDFPVYDPASAERHWDAQVALFRETLG